ncbi:DeoR/GlpR family DNA-binding transcription regulator [bacterium]|nr:DeoR/GlpR family DNA-binding transcription regulator [bacterium]
MLAKQRRQKILDLLEEEGSARVKALSETFNVSEPTIRQDLEKLEADNHITREHGGAQIKDFSTKVRSLSLHHMVNMDKKAAIGVKAAEFIEERDSIVLDSGSTTTEIAKNILEKKNITVVTNSLNIALLLGSNPSITVIVTGGEFKAPTLSLTGEKAAEFFEQIHISKLFLAVGAVSISGGLTFPGFNDINVKRAMINSAEKIYLVADSQKIGKTMLAPLCDVEKVDAFIVDQDIKPEDKAAFEAKGIEVIVAEA